MAQKKSAPKSLPTKTTNYNIGVGDPAPAFEAEATSGQTLKLKDFKGRALVLYFYPKDNTPGCTLEGQDFKRLQKKFDKADCAIVGVSKDSVRSHETFKEKCGFPFELLSDEDGVICKGFDVIQKKKLYGREFIGIERSTFLIAPNGKIAAEWRKVKVAGHADEVLAAAESL